MRNIAILPRSRNGWSQVDNRLQDLFDHNIVAGWAANVKAPTTPVSVDVYIDDRLQATLPADVFRQDLKDADYGDGRKGFSLPLVSPQSSPPGRIAKLLVAGSNQVLATRVRRQGKSTGMRMALV